jgi:hypothetical protein
MYSMETAALNEQRALREQEELVSTLWTTRVPSVYRKSTSMHKSSVVQYMLEYSISVCRNPGKEAKDQIAKHVGLKPSQVHNWFKDHFRKGFPRRHPKEALILEIE